MPENPYAFPQPFIRTPGDGQFESANQFGFGGMELRDYFAGQALIGVMVMRAAIRDQMPDDISQESIADEAYELADAMLAEREKKTEDADA